MSDYYNEISRTDVVAYFKAQLERGGFYLRDVDGKLAMDSRMSHDTPWHHIKHAFMDCQMWHRIMFDFVSANMANPFVPSKCQNCWKVVVRPQTLKGLFALEAIQIALDRPSKCGIEVRKSVHGLYGGYFYNPSFYEGIERYKEVRKAVDDHPDLGRDISVILKRACTEFEHLVGDSKYWCVTPRQMELEQMCERYVETDTFIRRQPDHLVRNIHRRWIEYAFQNGDGTYAEYTGGESLYPVYRTYHHLADATPEEIKDFWADVVQERDVAAAQGHDMMITNNNGHTAA